MSYFLAVRASFYHNLLLFKLSTKQLKTEEEETQLREEEQGGGAEPQGSADLLGEERQEKEKKAELNLTRTLELCKKCAALEPKLATKGYRFIIGALLREVKITAYACTAYYRCALQ